MEKDVLVKIQGKEITEKDLDRIIEKYPVEKRIYFETSAGRKQLLEQKTAFTLFGMYAKECGRDKEPDFVAHLCDIEEQMLTQMIMQELFAGLTVTEEETENFYRTHPERFAVEETVKARHILVETQEEAEQIRNKIISGEVSFEEAAKEYSICPSKEKGGDLGYFKRGMMVKEVEEAAFSLPVKECSQPVKSRFGCHLIEVLDKTEPGSLSYEEVAEKLKAQLLSEKQQAAYEEKLEELKERYHVCK